MITIYWGVNPQTIPEGMRYDPPVPILNNFLRSRKQKVTQNKIRQRNPNNKFLINVADGQSYGTTFDEKGLIDDLGYHRCPAFADELTNLYGIKSVYDYDIEVKDDQVNPRFDKRNEISDIDFFHKHVMIRSIKHRLFSFSQGIVFFTDMDTPSLIMSQLSPYMEDNTIAKNAIVVPGQFDIGKYFRTLDFAWHFRDNCERIKFDRDIITFYLRFHTKEKIKFRRFMWTKELGDLNGMMGSVKQRKEPELLSKALQFYYNIFDKHNLKKKMLKIIEDNLCKEEDSEGNVISS